MSKRVDLLISHVRSITMNELANSSTDISDDEILQYLNEAQYRIQAKILETHPETFETEYIMTVIQDQEEYYMPENAVDGSKIISIEYSANASSTRPVFWRLKPTSSKYRASHISSIPVAYWRRHKSGYPQGGFMITPPGTGTNGILRVVYPQKLNKLDIRRGVISSVSLNTATGVINNITIDPNGNPPIDFTEFATANYFCIVDKNGVMQMRNIPFAVDGATSISPTGVITVDPTFVYNYQQLTAGVQTAMPAGTDMVIETAAVGNYVVSGKNTTTHSQLPEDIERYLIQFAAYKIFKHDSSLDIQPQQAELGKLEEEIIKSFQQIDEDGNEILVVEEWNM